MTDASNDAQLTPEDYLETAEKVRTGEYFQEARGMYDLMVHDPMAERYMYVLITLSALVIFLVGFVGLQLLYPLRTSIPFAVSSNDMVEDVPHIKSLIEKPGEDPSEALLRFLVKNYVVTREEYNITTFDRSVNGVRSQSAEAVQAEYEQEIDPNNPDSPLTLYQRHSKRTITILSYKRLSDEEAAAEVEYEATVSSKTETKKTRWQANIAFNYSGIALDEETGKVTPLKFTVTEYRTKRLQDIVK